MGIECEQDAMAERKRKRSSSFQLDDIPEDGILCSIVSRLPMREAVRTSILSPRWRHLWMHATNLNFDSVNMFGVDRLGKSVRKLDNADRYRRWRKERREFIPAVNRFLDHHRGTGVDTFRVGFLLHNQHACHLNRWVEFAIASGAKHLVLNLDDEYIRCPKQPYEFPLHLFVGREGSSVDRLSLHFCTLNPPRNFDGLKCLKELHLDDVGVTEGDMSTILSSCSLIELLSINNCQSLFNLYIPQSSSRLTYLNVEECDELKRIESHAMNLNTLEYREPYKCRASLLFRESSQLMSASICAFGSHAVVLDVLNRLPRDLPYLETLCLDMYSTSAAVTSPKVTHVFAHLKHLTIFSGYGLSTNICWVAALLRAAPVMAKLNLHIDFFPKGSTKCKIVEPCPHVNLKEVMITGFTGHSDELELAKYVLHNATTLELMTINLRRAKYFKLKVILKLKNPKGPRSIHELSRYFQRIAPPSVNMVIV